MRRLLFSSPGKKWNSDHAIIYLLGFACSRVHVGLFAGVCAPQGPSEPESDIDAILARASALFSGRLRYTVNSGFIIPKIQYPAKEFELTFSGTSWLLKQRVKASDVPVMVHENGKEKETYPPREGFLEKDRLSHQGRYIVFNVSPQVNRPEMYSARITYEKEEPNPPWPRQPRYLGSIWDECTRQFIERQKGKAVRRETADINGLRCQVFEWVVPPSEKYKAFQSVNKLVENGGWLRLYAFPEYGYVLPRIEFLGKDRALFKSYESSDFQKTEPGIYIPKRFRLQVYDSQGPGMFMEYNVHDPIQINQPIPESDFRIMLPVGTEIADSRPGDHSNMFTVKAGGPLPPDMDDDLVIVKPSILGWNWPTALISGLALGMLCVIVFLVARRYSCARHA